MTDWNLADVLEVVADVRPSGLAQRCDDQTFTWEQFDRRANALATDLLEAGLGHQAKVGAYLRNGPEYLEVYLAAFKAAMAPFNLNYRYGPAEVAYILANADCEAVVFHSSYAPLLDEIRGQLPAVRRWYVVDDGGDLPDWAIPYEKVVSAGAGRPTLPWKRSGDDLLLLYTGGTTGMPKGVMWRQDDLVNVLGGGGNPITGVPPAKDIDELRQRLADAAASGAEPLSAMPACPLMHGTGQFSAFIAMIGGGCIVTLADRRFDAARLWDAVERYEVNAVSIVGDAFARPMLAALDAEPGRWNLSKLIVINSSGVMWSQEVKDGLLRHLPNVVLFDSLGSSEAVGLAANVSAAGAAAQTARFSVGDGVRVLDPDDRDVEPGSGVVGVLAIKGFVPVGYYKDPEKSARTFRSLDGARYSIPGDYATVDSDGTIHLLGRGSVVINSGGEKIYPEEVEEAVKHVPEVADAVCVGIPDERFGESICAIVEARPGAVVDAEKVKETVRAELAGYKVPRKVMVVESIGRSPAGKVDYPALKARAAADQA